ncbi:hypothetical protein K0M31_009800 [Melipona bicolor]|uniref:Uncharacterized protein n=1 Tax=Melipona bicolor TaxID=60889 RepID=A0AA40KIT8_9HYME|nr:hypothetical protein K0M31_009800 [Melipona bicolor]
MAASISTIDRERARRIDSSLSAITDRLTGRPFELRRKKTNKKQKKEKTKKKKKRKSSASQCAFAASDCSRNESLCTAKDRFSSRFAASSPDQREMETSNWLRNW